MIASRVSLAWIIMFSTCALVPPPAGKRRGSLRKSDRPTGGQSLQSLLGFHTVTRHLFRPSFRHYSLSAPEPQCRQDGGTEHEGAICHSAPAPSRVLRAHRSPLTRLSCHVRWLTGKVTSGDKRPQLGSVSNPAFLTMHVCTRAPRSVCVPPGARQKDQKKKPKTRRLRLTQQRQPSERAAVQLIFFFFLSPYNSVTIEGGWGRVGWGGVDA